MILSVITHILALNAGFILCLVLMPMFAAAKRADQGMEIE